MMPSTPMPIPLSVAPMTMYGKFHAFFTQVIEGTTISRFSLLVGLIVLVVLQNSQSVESLSVMAEDPGTFGVRLWLLVLFAVFLELMLWYSVRVLHYLVGPEEPVGVAWFMANQLPRVCGMLPGIALCLSLHGACSAQAANQAAQAGHPTAG